MAQVAVLLFFNNWAGKINAVRAQSAALSVQGLLARRPPPAYTVFSLPILPPVACCMFRPEVEFDYASWIVARRADGALLVRVPSVPVSALPLPDAVFTFRNGDPQFDHWEQVFREREQLANVEIPVAAAN